MPTKNSNDTIGNRTRYLPVFSAVPEPNRVLPNGKLNMEYLILAYLLKLIVIEN